MLLSLAKGDGEFAECPVPYPTKEWRARGIRAEDGDTMVVKLDTGWWETKTIDIRLNSIDCYELHKGTPEDRALGELARKFTQARVAGKWLYVVTSMDAEKYGRILADVFYWTDAGNLTNLADRLRAAGYEKPKA